MKGNDWHAAGDLRAARRRSVAVKPKTENSVPDISGRWEGWSYRVLTREWRPSAQEFMQTEEDIVANAWGPQNWARGLSAKIVQDGATYELIWSYRTQNTDRGGKPGDAHLGTHFLKYSERNGHKYLEGRYVTDRPREDETFGAGGYHRLVWVSSKPKGALAFKESEWGLPKPADDVTSTKGENH